MEYMIPKGRSIIVHEGDYVKRGDMLVNGNIVMQDVLRILGIGDELLKASRGEKTKYDYPPEGSDLLLGAHPSKKQRNTQICPQCDWEIDAGYTVCPHCHFYLSRGAENGGKG